MAEIGPFSTICLFLQLASWWEDCLWAMSPGWLSGLTSLSQEQAPGLYLSTHTVCQMCLLQMKLLWGTKCPHYPLGPLQGKDSISLENTSALACLGVVVANIITASGFAMISCQWGREESDWQNCTSSGHRTSIKTDFCPVSHSDSLPGLTTKNRFISVKTLLPPSHIC